MELQNTAPDREDVRFVEADPLPPVCRTCAERQACIARGEGEWCCDECDHLGQRFYRMTGP